MNVNECQHVEAAAKLGDQYQVKNNGQPDTF